MMLLPPGIQNSGNVCFASTVLHCLLNQKLIREVLHDVEQSHLPECRECKQGKQNIIALSLIKYTTQSQTAA